MDIVIVLNEPAFPEVEEIVIKNEPDELPPAKTATEEDIAACPASFRCFVCQRKFTPKHLAGVILSQRVCDQCWGYTDKYEIRGFIRFDTKHGFLVKDFPNAKHGGFNSRHADGSKWNQFDYLTSQKEIDARMREEVMEALK